MPICAYWALSGLTTVPNRQYHIQSKATGATMDEKMYYTLKRYQEEYGWYYRLATKIINRTFHTGYRAAELRALYEVKKAEMEAKEDEDTKSKNFEKW